MLVLLSCALALAALVFLVLGLLNDDGLAFFYLTIACSAAAAVLLVVWVRRNRTTAEAGVAPAAEASPAATPVAEAPAAEAPVAAEPVADGGAWPPSEAEEPQEAIFPIADYDELTAGQILPLLPQLYTHEIGVVEARELATKARPEILEGLAELRGDAPTADAATAVRATSVWDGEDGWFPIDDYESLTVAEIRPLLRELDHEELILVRDRELASGQRRTVLTDIDRRLASSGPVEKAAAPPEEGASPAEEAADESL